jgi:hypothetical protein
MPPSAAGVPWQSPAKWTDYAQFVPLRFADVPDLTSTGTPADPQANPADAPADPQEDSVDAPADSSSEPSSPASRGSSEVPAGTNDKTLKSNDVAARQGAHQALASLVPQIAQPCPQRVVNVHPVSRTLAGVLVALVGLCQRYSRSGTGAQGRKPLRNKK